MPEPTETGPPLGESRLIFFFNDRLRPILLKLGSLHSLPESPQRDYLATELLESFLWLHGGVEIGYFPQAQSRRITYEYFPLFLKAYETVRPKSYFETWFSRPLRDLWLSEFSGRVELFSAGTVWTPSDVPSETALLFQQFFSLANGFADDTLASSFTQALVLALDPTWKHALDQNRPIAGLQSPLPEMLNVDAAHWALPGFLATFDYMQAFRRLREGFNPNTNVFSQKFLQRLKEPQQWRLNFGYPVYRDRFYEVALLASKYLYNSVEASFMNEVSELMTEWGASSARTASA